jgi:hypothetical protein
MRDLLQMVEITSIQRIYKFILSGCSAKNLVYLKWCSQMKNCKYCLLSIFLWTGPGVFAQLDNEALNFRLPVVEADSGSLLFSLNALGYLRNNEYFNEVADGRTFFGLQIQPAISFLPHKHFRLDAGVFLQKDFGEPEFSDVQAVFTLHYHRKAFELLFGTLDGAYRHRLIEPLYGFERGLTNRYENGLQIRFDNDRTFVDFWIDWQNALFPGDSSQEEIFGGLSFDHRWVANDQVSFSTPLQLLVFHKGGQIDISEAPLVTQMNYALGLNLTWFPEVSWLSSLRTENYFVGFNDNSGQPENFDQGFGVFLNLGARYNRFEWLTSYWYGEDFEGVIGGDIYQSVSQRVRNNNQIVNTRSLLFFRFFYTIPLLEMLDLALRVEPLLDLESSDFEYSFGFYLRTSTDILLWKRKDK